MVAFWILDTYPMHAPICYIQPDNSFGIKNKVFSRLNSADVEINISKYVDGTGKLYLPYVLEWKPKTSNIVEVIKDYKHQFVKQSPIFLRSQGQPEPGLLTWMSFLVSSALECSVYRWLLFVYFTFPST